MSDVPAPLPDSSALVTSSLPAERRVVHLPCYDVNPYQHLLMNRIEAKGFAVLDGGGGGNFFRSALFRWKAKYIHLHWLHPYIIRDTWLASAIRGTRLVLELLALRIAGKRLVWTVHNLHNHQDQFRGIERRVCRWVAKLAGGLICHSQYAAEAACQAYGVRRDKVTVSPHPIWQRHTNLISPEQARSKLQIASECCVFLFIGRVSQYKGVEELIAAFAEVSSPLARLVIAGGPTSAEYGEKVTALAERDSRIQLHLHFVEDDQMQTYLNAADAVVFPFKEILTSGSVLLAMEFSKPCVVPAIGAIPETLPSEQDELTYDPTKTNGLKESLNKVVELNGEALREIGAANRRKSAAWTWENLADDCIELYV